jgi:hypothetical protein
MASVRGSLFGCFAALVCGVCRAQDFPIDVVRVDLDGYAIGLYGCWTHFVPGVGLSANCAGAVRLSGPNAPHDGVWIEVAAVSPQYEHWAMNSPPCLLLSATIGSLGENRYEVYCGDGLFRNGFEGS